METNNPTRIDFSLNTDRAKILADAHRFWNDDSSSTTPFKIYVITDEHIQKLLNSQIVANLLPINLRTFFKTKIYLRLRISNYTNKTTNFATWSTYSLRKNIFSLFDSNINLSNFKYFSDSNNIWLSISESEYRGLNNDISDGICAVLCKDDLGNHYVYVAAFNVFRENVTVLLPTGIGTVFSNEIDILGSGGGGGGNNAGARFPS